MNPILELKNDNKGKKNKTIFFTMANTDIPLCRSDDKPYTLQMLFNIIAVFNSIYVLEAILFCPAIAAPFNARNIAEMIIDPEANVDVNNVFHTPRNCEYREVN